MNLTRLTVKAKLTLGFTLIAVIAGIIGVVGFSFIRQINGMAKDMYDYELLGLYAAGRADSDLRTAGRAVRAAIIAPAVSKQEAFGIAESTFSALDRSTNALLPYFRSTEGQAKIRELMGVIRDYRNSAQRILEELRQNRPDMQERVTAILVDETRVLGNRAEAMMSELLEQKRANAEQVGHEGEEVAGNAAIILLLLTIVGVVTAGALGWVIARGISRQLGGEPAQVAAVADAISRGDLTMDLKATGVPAGSIMASMIAMQASLRRLVAQLLQSSRSIATGASEIAAGNTDLSQRTEEQAASLTQTASAMEEISGTVQSNADVARQAAQRAAVASKSAEHGGRVAAEVTRTMAEIHDSSRRIVDIISVIDSIAFQTNILALNAAVEAARAGDQGRGFAVVAGEVRSLAQKSAAAAKDIKALIDDSVQRVEDGTRQVNAAGEAMNEIVREVKQVTDLISEISAATTEQTSGISQINQAVLQLSDVTQQNAALVEQSAAAAASLDEQARRLVELVNQFKVDADALQSAATPLLNNHAHAAPAGSRALAAPSKHASVKVAHRPRPAVSAVHWQSQNQSQTREAEPAWEEF
jgi:methyl-accepting chemotaxis protein